MAAIEELSRRGFLRSAARLMTSLALAGSRTSSASAIPDIAEHGAIKPPRPLPDLRVTRMDGVATSLGALATDHVTALQLMFTTCTTTCPMQGAIFERVQRLAASRMRSGKGQGIQLISLSVDPKHDSPAALSEWLKMFHSGPEWIGVTPDAKDIGTVREFFGAGRDALDPHSTQTHIIDRQGRLVWRTYELPSPEEIVSVLKRV